MDRLEIFQERLTNGFKTIFRIRHTPATPPAVEAALPIPSVDEDSFTKQQIAGLAEIFHSPDTEVVVDPESGLHRLMKVEEITVKI